MIQDTSLNELLGLEVQTPDAAQVPELPDVGEFRKLYRQAFDAADEERTLAFRCTDYYHGHEQLSSEIRAKLAKRGQPPSYWNKIRPAINGVLGLLDSGETDAEATARNENGEQAATVVTKVLRYFSDANDFPDSKRSCSFDLLVPGTGAAIVEVHENGDARVTDIPFAEFFHDPYSLRHDFQDARYLGRAKWVHTAVAKRMFPEAAARLGNLTGSFDGSDPEDMPKQKAIWADASRGRVLLVEMYHQDDATDQWMHTTFCHAGVLDHELSPYLDDQGQTVCPIVALSFEVDRSGKRYGMIPDMLPLQDGINARLSRMLNITNSAQVEPTEGANPVDKETARAEAARADGVMPMGYKRTPMTDVFQGNAILLQNDVEALERMAPSPALLGRAGGANESGRARQVLQQAGMSELARAFSRWEHWELRVYRQMWFRAQQYLTDARRIRITNDAGAAEHLIVNYPLTEQHPMPVVDPQTGQTIVQMQEVPVGVENELASMDMEITVKTVRQVDTLRQEGFEACLEYAAKSGISPLDPAFELVIEMAPIPDKEAILAKYNAVRGKAAQEAQQAQAAQQQMAMQQQAVNQAATQSKIDRDGAQADRDRALADKHNVEADDAAFSLAMKQTLAEHGIHPNSQG